MSSVVKVIHSTKREAPFPFKSHILYFSVISADVYLVHITNFADNRHVKISFNIGTKFSRRHIEIFFLLFPENTI